MLIKEMALLLTSEVKLKVNDFFINESCKDSLIMRNEMNYYDEHYEYGNKKNIPDVDSKRDIHISDEDTWEIYYDLSDFISKRIPRNEYERDEHTFMKGIIGYLKQDGYLSEKQMARLQVIYEKYYK